MVTITSISRWFFRSVNVSLIYIRICGHPPISLYLCDCICSASFGQPFDSCSHVCLLCASSLRRRPRLLSLEIWTHMHAYINHTYTVKYSKYKYVRVYEMLWHLWHWLASNLMPRIYIHVRVFQFYWVSLNYYTIHFAVDGNILFELVWTFFCATLHFVFDANFRCPIFILCLAKKFIYFCYSLFYCLWNAILHCIWYSYQI